MTRIMTTETQRAETLPVLRSERLVLRPWRDSDLAPFADLNADPVVMEHFPATLSRAESDAVAERAQAELAKHGFSWFAVEVPGAAPFIGFIGLWAPSFAAPFTSIQDPIVEVGWRLAKEHWGKGYATEGARACLRFGFEDLGLKEIVSFTAVPNLPSQRVMQRLGMTHDPAGDFDHPVLPKGHRLERHVLYRIRREEWA
ncbi:GNAT family N-acetyltransferase [Pelagibius sp.]|uniref:GNAT family N-acetyltransferase n=1 Tax=Pelagibius sp. TaxID=1931238 RepID=UPI0026106046|nr:GNAT family N-acetyltransferase [Pelagibius sp.]